MARSKFKIGDFVFVDSTRGNTTLRNWHGKGYGVVTAVENMIDVPFAQVFVNGDLRWVLVEDITKNSAENQWFLYVLKCADGTYYTGITTDPGRRLHEHNSTKKGAKYTRSRRPNTIVFCAEFANRSSAARAESTLRRCSKSQKENVIQGQVSIDELVAFD